MNQVYVLPTKNLKPSQIRRLTDDLTQALENDVNISSRVLHIHATGRTLQEMCDILAGLVDTLFSKNCVAEAEPARIACHKMIEETRCLAGLALQYPG